MGKSLNPADAQRKADRKREVKKNKVARTTARTDKLFSSPALLREELEKWRKLKPGEAGEDGEKLDPKSIANRVKKLEEAYAAALRSKRARARFTALWRWMLTPECRRSRSERPRRPPRSRASCTPCPSSTRLRRGRQPAAPRPRGGLSCRCTTTRS
jgi:hypothetical protein